MIHRRSILAGLLTAAALLAPRAFGLPYAFQYGGRLVEPSGAPVQGPVHLVARFFDAAQDGTKLGPDVDLADVPLTNGVFTAALALAPASFQAVFGGSGDTWIEVEDVTHGKTYPRQRFAAVPYALRVPVDGTTLAYDADGKLAVATVPEHAHALSGDVSGTLAAASVVKLQGRPVSASNPAPNDFLKWNSTTSTWEPGGVLGASGGTVTSLTLGAGLTGSSNPITTSGTVDLAPDGVTSAKILDGTIVNADVSASAAITDDKLATIATAGKVADTALSAQVTKLGPTVELGGAEVAGTLPVAAGGTGATSAAANAVFAGPASGGAAAPAFRALVSADIAAVESDPKIGANTTNYLSKWNGSALVAGAVYDDGAGKIGIGTSSPADTLEVSGGDVRVTNGSDYARITASGNPAIFLFNAGVGDLRLVNDGMFKFNNAGTDLASISITDGTYTSGGDLVLGANRTGGAASGIAFKGAGVRHGNLLFDPNQNRFELHTNNSATGSADAYGPPSLIVPGTIESTTGGIKFPDGTTQTTASRTWAASRPRMVYATASTVTVQAQSGSTMRVTMNDGSTRAHAGALTFDFANGAADLGLDTGVEQASKWYYLYAVPAGAGDFTLRASVTVPATGPTGFATFGYFGAFYNDSASNIPKWYHTGGQDFRWAQRTQEFAGGGANYALHDITLAYVPLTASEGTFTVSFEHNASATCGITQIFHVEGETTNYVVNRLAGVSYDRDHQTLPIPLPGTAAKVVRHESTSDCAPGVYTLSQDLYTLGWKDAWVVD